MKLEVATFDVDEIRVGRDTMLRDGVLTVALNDLRALLCQDARLKDVTIELARPGDAVRVVHVLDAVEPRVKVAPAGACFPGLLGTMREAGAGRTHRLAGTAVLLAAEMPPVSGEVSHLESILDMSGPAAAYSPFARLNNLVVAPRFNQGLSYLECQAAAQQASLRAADYLAAVTRGRAPDGVEAFALGPAPGLPRVLAATLIGSDGLTHTCHVCGQAAAAMVPTLIHPNVLFDGGVVNACYPFASLRNPTYSYQNHPPALALYRRHGRSVDFRGVLLGRSIWPSHGEKSRSAEYLGLLAETLGADGVVISLDGAGHAMSDLMLACQACEQRGIRTTLLTFEMAGDDGSDVGVVDRAPEADAIVSCGNMDERITLPSMSRVVGGAHWLNAGEVGFAGLPTEAAMEAPLRVIFAATSQLGGNAVGVRAC